MQCLSDRSNCEPFRGIFFRHKKSWTILWNVFQSEEIVDHLVECFSDSTICRLFCGFFSDRTNCGPFCGNFFQTEEIAEYFTTADRTDIVSHFSNSSYDS